MEFEDYAICLNGEKGDRFAGFVVAGIGWGFVQNSVQIKTDNWFWPNTVESVPVFTMQPVKSLGDKQTPEFKAAIEKVAAYYHQQPIVFLDGP